MHLSRICLFMRVNNFFHAVKNVTRFERALKHPGNDGTMLYTELYVVIKYNPVMRTSFKNVDIPWASITGMKRLTANTHVANQHEIGAAWVVRFVALVFLSFFLFVLKITFNIYLHIYTHTHAHISCEEEGNFYFILRSTSS